MNRLFWTIAFGFIFNFYANAQLITADPPFPTQTDAVTITFDATQGDGGLAGFTGDVYAHTGVITNESTSGSDWKHVKAGWTQNIPECKMTYLGNDLWQLNITPSINDYYGVNAGEIVLKLAFVFRSADGSVTGRAEDGGDIFYDIYQSGINVQITLPDQQPLIVLQGENIRIEGNSTGADSTRLYIDNNLILSTTDSAFGYDRTAGEFGKHWIKAVAYGPDGTASDSTSYFVRTEPVVAALPQSIRDGINYLSDTSVVLSLYAPGKSYVFVIGDFNNWETDADYYARITPDGKRFWVEIDGLEPGKEYIFQYLVDGSIKIGDPYADKVSDPWNDKYIDNSTYPGLIEYPTGKTSGIATVLQTAQQPYNWQVTDFTPPDENKLVVYELLVRDFTEGHTFNDIIDTLSYLKHLGITAIELMPVSEFEGNISWGYNPNYYFAPDKYYGPKNSFKAFVDACHSKGIAVIMDMVLNHAYGTCPLAMLYWDSEHNRPAADNPWFNVTSPNPLYSWGNDFNHESQDTKNFVDSVNRYWMSEYKIDGFRFDFTKGFTNTPGDGWAYDASRINILKRMADSIWAFNPDAYVILEHFTANSEEKVLAGYGMMIWGNSNYNYNEATMGWNDNSDFSWISYKQRGWSSPKVMGYMESHDEERLMYKNLEYGNSSGSYNVKDLNTALKRNEMAAAFFIPIPGPKMIWQFGELGYDYSINRCEDGSNNESCRTHPKPIRWDYYYNVNRYSLYSVYAALNYLKQTEPAFSTTDFQLSVSGALKSIHLNGDNTDVTIIGNFDVKQGSINPAFQKAGTWYDLLTGDSISVSDPSASVTLAPGEYHLYSTKYIDVPWVGIPENKPENVRLNLFPNPASEQLTVVLHTKKTAPVTLKIYSATGSLIKVLYQGKANAGQLLRSINVSDFPRGMYFLTAEQGGKLLSKKFIVN